MNKPGYAEKCRDKQKRRQMRQEAVATAETAKESHGVVA